MLNVDNRDTHSSYCTMNNKILIIAVVAAVASMLVATSAVATEDAFADKKKKYEKSQAASQANACGNGEAAGIGITEVRVGPVNVFCQNLASQIQGDNNAPALTGEQGPGLVLGPG